MQEDFAARDRFMITLDWLLALHERYPGNSLDFALLHVCFHDQQRLGQIYGAPEAYHLLAEVGSKLRLAFRRTDLVARDGTDFWILAPYTTPESVIEKIATLVAIASADGLNIVDRDVTVFSLPDPTLSEQAPLSSAAAFLAHLKEHRQQAACRWAPVMPAK